MHIFSYVRIVAIATVITLHAAEESTKKSNKRFAESAVNVSSSSKRPRVAEEAAESPVVTCYVVDAASPTSDEALSSSGDEQESELIQAIEDGNVEKVKDLIQKGADVRECGADGASLFYYAAINSPKTASKIIAILLKTNAQPCDLYKHLIATRFVSFSLPQSALPTPPLS